MASTELRVACELGATVVRPGQTLVLCTPHELTAVQAAELVARVRAQLPGVEPVILAGVTQALVYELPDVRVVDG